MTQSASILAGVGITQEEKFKQMLERDKVIYANIVKIRAFQQSIQLALANYDRGKRTAIRNQGEYDRIKSVLNASYSTWYDLQKKYNDRQTDIRTNPVYRLGNQLTEWSDSAVTWFKNAWNSTTGVGAAPLAVPVVIAAGAVLTTVSVGYFVTKYYTDAGTQYNEALGTVATLSETNPTLAAQMNEQIAEFYKKKQEEQGGGLFNELGKGLGDGLKWGLILFGTGAGVFGIYKVGENQGWWKKSKKRK